MEDTVDINDILLSYLPTKRQSTSSGWTKFNCPMCVPMGTTPDTKQRGGIKVQGDTTIYNCFNCDFKAVWTVGDSLSNKFQWLLKTLGVSSSEIRRINFSLFRQKQLSTLNNFKTINVTSKPLFEKSELPKDSMSFIEMVELSNPPEDFIDVVNYVSRRGTFLLDWDLYWSPKYSRRVIIPFFDEQNKKITGWTARYIDKSVKNVPPKYIMEKQKDYLFNCHTMTIPMREYIILVEGPFDAMAIDSVGCVGKSLTDRQISWIKSCRKKVVVVPDFEVGQSSTLIDYALREEWLCSLPWEWNQKNKKWDRTIKDVSDAVQTNGRLITLYDIINSIVDDPFKIKLFQKMRMTR